MAKEDSKADAPITRDELLTLVQTLVANNSLTIEKVREIAQATTRETYEHTSGQFWDIKNYPKVSDFNPAGDLAAPRGKLLGEVFWIGYKLSEAELTPREIELINQLDPGLYGPEGVWVVKDLQPGMRDRTKRRILVLFPCKDEDTRARLPQGDPWNRKTAVEQICEVMLGLTALRQPALA